MKRLKTLISFKYSRVKLKNQKPIAVDVLFKAYPMVPHTCIDPIWTDGTFKVLEEEMTSVPLMLFSAVK
jgi:hypothetical protein